MTKQLKTAESIAPLRAAGLDASVSAAWMSAQPRTHAEFAEDCRIFTELWRQSARLLAKLPNKAQRNSAERMAAELIERHAREARTSFLAAHVGSFYNRLTDRRSRFLRIDELLAAAAVAAPGLVPAVDELEADRERPLRDKSGVEIDQGLFLSAMLASERHGRHLCHAMLLPREDAVALAPRLAHAARGSQDAT